MNHEMMIIVLAFGFPAAPECTFLLILAFILVGPKKLPLIARSCAKLLGELQNAKDELTREILQIPIVPKIQEPREKKIHQSVPDTFNKKKD